MLHAGIPLLADVLGQVIELYSENGLDRSFFCTFATPWSGNVIRILNTGPMEYPLTASIVRARASGDSGMAKLR